MEQIEASINRYLSALDVADQQEAGTEHGRSSKLKEKIEALKKRMHQLKEIGVLVQAAPDKQISLTDPDARSMATSGKGTGVVGYNVQTAVDAQHHLIVAHEVTNVGNDRGQLASMAQQAQTAMGRKDLEAIADKGYFKGEEILECESVGITPFVPKPLTSGSKAVGRFGKQDFVYVAEDNTYRCPAGQRLTWRFASVEDGMTLHSYWTSACQECPLKAKCTTGKERRIKRWEHEGVLETKQQRLDQAPEKMARIIGAILCRFHGHLLVLARERGKLQRLEMIAEQYLGRDGGQRRGVAGHRHARAPAAIDAGRALATRSR